MFQWTVSDRNVPIPHGILSSLCGCVKCHQVKANCDPIGISRQVGKQKWFAIAFFCKVFLGSLPAKYWPCLASQMWRDQAIVYHSTSLWSLYHPIISWLSSENHIVLWHTEAQLCFPFWSWTCLIKYWLDIRNQVLHLSLVPFFYLFVLTHVPAMVRII